MLQTLLALALTLAPARPAGPQDPGAVVGRDPEAVALLERAATAAAALHSAAYEARSEVRQGGAQEQPSQASGKVRFDARELEPEGEPVGARLSVEGRVPGAGPGGAELAFKVAYDGVTVRGRFGAEPVVWEGAIDGDGAEILVISDALVMGELHSRTPFAEALKAEGLQLGEDVDVGGVACRTVMVQFGAERKHAKYMWFLSSEDHLPRRRVSELHRRGVFTIELLEISKLVKNPQIYPTVFQFPIAAGLELKPFVSSRPKGPQLLAPGSAAPAFSLKDAEGNTHTLADYRGKILVLDFWATWCPPCKQAMPLVQKIHERFRENDDVVVVGIATSERAGGDPAGFMKKNGYTYLCLLNGETVAPAYQAFGLPTFYVIGRGGEVLHASTGFDAKLHKKIGQLIEDALAGQGG